MAAIQCPGCKAHLSVPGLVNCPRCQTYLSPPHLAPTRAPAPPLMTKAKATNLLGMVVIAGIGISVAAIVYRLAFPSQEDVRAKASSQALVGCQFAIQSAAQYGGADLPPPVQNGSRPQDDEFYFAWPPGSFEFSNGFGAKEKMSASCIGTLSTGAIKQLTINGKDFK
jgi:hypothetical protein